MRLLLLAALVASAIAAPIETLKERVAGAAVEVAETETEDKHHGGHHGGHHHGHHNGHHHGHGHHGKTHPHGGHKHHHLKDGEGALAEVETEVENKGLYCEQFFTYSTCHYNANNGCSWNFAGPDATKCSCDNFGNGYNINNVAPDNANCPNNGNAASLCFGTNPLPYNLGSASSPTACDAQVTQQYFYYYAYNPSTQTCYGGGYGLYNGASTQGGQPLVQASNATPNNCQFIVGRVDGGQIN